ncbi:hypothetical protein TNCV_1760321 [Trichonephila clavipes]|nr:hypothetical protein TNCV_1760321 [Trichonephila clavipes]
MLSCSNHIGCATIFENSTLKSSAETGFNGQGPDFYQDRLKKLVLRSDKCLNKLGDYVETAPLKSGKESSRISLRACVEYYEVMMSGAQHFHQRLTDWEFYCGKAILLLMHQFRDVIGRSFVLWVAVPNNKYFMLLWEF